MLDVRALSVKTTYFVSRAVYFRESESVNVFGIKIIYLDYGCRSNRVLFKGFNLKAVHHRLEV